MQGINNLLSNLVSVLQNIEIQDPALSRQFTVGQRLEALVLSRDGDDYLVQSGAKLFRAQSDLNLPVGEKLFLYVSEQKDGRTFLKIELPVNPRQAEDVNQAAKAKNIDIVPQKLSLLKPSALLTSQPDLVDSLSEVNMLPGRFFEAVVKGKNGNYYLVEAGSDNFFVEADTDLQPGERLQLLVKEEAGDRVMLERVGPKPAEQEQVMERVKLLAAKYGFTGEKEINQLAEQLAKLPVDEKTGVRYLLDPHLATAIIIPDQLRANHQAKIEIEQYKQALGSQRVWEVNLDVNLVELGPLEIVLKLIDGRIYARIWAEQPETETLLRARQDELELQITLIEIVPVTAGPLIPRENEDIIDMRV